MESIEEADMKCGLSENKRFVVISLLPNREILLSRFQALEFAVSLLEEVRNIEEEESGIPASIPPIQSPRAQ